MSVLRRCLSHRGVRLDNVDCTLFIWPPHYFELDFMAEWWFHKQGYCSSEILRCDFHIDDVQNFQNFDRIKYPSICVQFFFIHKRTFNHWKTSVNHSSLTSWFLIFVLHSGQVRIRIRNTSLSNCSFFVIWTKGDCIKIRYHKTLVKWPRVNKAKCENVDK